MPKTKAKTLYADHKQADLIDQVMELRSDDKSWSEVSDALSIGQGKAMYMEMIGNVDDDTLIDSDSLSETALAKAIVAAREKEKQSWGQISARTLGKVGEGKVRSLYESASGKSASDSEIGKGGLRAGANGSAAPAKKASAGKKAPAKKAGAVSDGKKLLKDMDLSELQARLDGVKIQNPAGDIINVESVSALASGTMTYVDGTTGKKAKIKVVDIKKAAPKK